MTVHEEINAAFAAMGIADARLVLSNRPDIADYTCDAAFAAARTMRRPPVAIANEAITHLSERGYRAWAIGGFLNIRLDDTTIASGVHLVPYPSSGRTILIDSGGPNTAKPMHVGHLRSLVIGDSLARILRYLGHRVIKDIHFGDWGYQMGLLLAALPVIPSTIGELEAAYPAAAQRAKDDPEFKAAAHRATVALQNDDEEARGRWQQLRGLSSETVYRDIDALGVEFDIHNGESDSQVYMADTERLLGNRLIESDGALIVDTPVGPLLFRNSQGGYLYGATDLATVVARDADLSLDEVLYVVDERQAQYFEQMFDAAKTLTSTKLEHVGFGTVNGPDGKPFRTRAGGVPRLSDLIDETISKAAVRNPTVAREVGVAALKFGDLINRRTSSYTFDLDKALRFEGKTGVYMLYQIVRIRSIIAQASVEAGDILIEDESERALAFQMREFNSTIEHAGEQRMSHLVAEYAYELSQRFSRFYTGAPIKTSPSRLALAKATLERLEILMGLLGIETVERM